MKPLLFAFYLLSLVDVYTIKVTHHVPGSPHAANVVSTATDGVAKAATAVTPEAAKPATEQHEVTVQPVAAHQEPKEAAEKPVEAAKTNETHAKVEEPTVATVAQELTGNQQHEHAAKQEEHKEGAKTVESHDDKATAVEEPVVKAKTETETQPKPAAAPEAPKVPAVPAEAKEPVVEKTQQNETTQGHEQPGHGQQGPEQQPKSEVKAADSASAEKKAGEAQHPEQVKAEEHANEKAVEQAAQPAAHAAPPAQPPAVPPAQPEAQPAAKVDQNKPAGDAAQSDVDGKHAEGEQQPAAPHGQDEKTGTPAEAVPNAPHVTEPAAPKADVTEVHADEQNVAKKEQALGGFMTLAPARGNSGGGEKEPLTLETMVKVGSICEKQQIITRYVKQQLKNGPLRPTFDPILQDNVYLAMCKSVLSKKPSVCKKQNITSQPLCPKNNMSAVVDEYLVHGVCTVEAAINQLYHTESKGSFVYSEMEAVMGVIKALPQLENETTKLLKQSESILESITKLFKEAELALVSKKVQNVFYKRWALMETLLCGVAAGNENDIVDNVVVDVARHTSHLKVDLEAFIAEATAVFLEAYKPMEAMIAIVGGDILSKAIKLDKESFSSDMKNLIAVIKDMHLPTVSDKVMEELKKIPHTNLDFGDVESIAEKLKGQVSLVEREENTVSNTVAGMLGKITGGKDATPAKLGDIMKQLKSKDTELSPIDAFRKVLISLEIFTYQGNHILPKLDVASIKETVRSALLDLSDEEMVAKLIVKHQAALRLFYLIVKKMIPLPATDLTKAATTINPFAKGIGDIAKEIEGHINRVRDSVSTYALPKGQAHDAHKEADGEGHPKAPEVQLTASSMLQLAHRSRVRHNSKGNERGDVTGDHTDSNFVVESSSGGVDLESKTDKYVTLTKFQTASTNLLNINSFSMPSAIATVAVAFIGISVAF